MDLFTLSGLSLSIETKILDELGYQQKPDVVFYDTLKILTTAVETTLLTSRRQFWLIHKSKNPTNENQ